MKRITLFLWLFCLSAPLIANPESSPAATLVVHYDYEILAERSHKTSLFTQGLVLDNDIFYESSGLYGKSMLVSYPKSEPENKWSQMTAPFLQKDRLPDHYFAEGLTLLDDKLYLITWQEGTVFVYDRATFEIKHRWQFSGQGWGLTDDGTNLIRSDGSQYLHIHSPDKFALLKSVAVTEEGRPVHRLNELEFIDGYVWANVWHENRLVQIDPATGHVTGSLDLTALTARTSLENSESVLNGIAHDEAQGGLWITGKNWPVMYLIKVTHLNATQPSSSQ